MERPPLPSIRETRRPNAVFSASSDSSNQNDGYLSDAGFFYTVVVIDKQKLFINRRNILLKTPLIKIVLLQEKKTTQSVYIAVLL
jgi:hypothetical protein